MTQNTNEPTHPLPEGQLLQILIQNDGGRLMYSAKWFRQLDAQQQYLVAETADRVLRTISPRYKENVEKVDEAARIGFALQDRGPLNKMVLSLLRLRSWREVDPDDRPSD